VFDFDRKMELVFKNAEQRDELGVTSPDDFLERLQPIVLVTRVIILTLITRITFIKLKQLRD
jgi:hypothetical protein